MAFSEIYVDPSIDADSGTGTIGDPFGDTGYGIKQTTFDTTNGTRVNIKAGTDEILAAELDAALADTGTTAAWTPSATAPCIFQGYTTTAGDGGLCGISGGDAVEIISTARNNIWFIDCHLHSTGTGAVVSGNNWFHLLRCWVETDITAGTAISGTFFSRVQDCYITCAAGGSGVSIVTIGTIGRLYHNQIDITGASNLTIAATCSGGQAERNIVICDTGYGILLTNAGSAINNSIYANASTRRGIYTTNTNPCVIRNNLVEGFSGAGGVGILDTNASPMSGGNGVYNCTTAYNLAEIGLDYGDNETLSASPFVDAANGDFRPVNVGNVLYGALPQVIGGGLAPVANAIRLHKGAVHPLATSGVGRLIGRGGLIGG